MIPTESFPFRYKTASKSLASGSESSSLDSYGATDSAQDFAQTKRVCQCDLVMRTVSNFGVHDVGRLVLWISWA